MGGACDGRDTVLDEELREIVTPLRKTQHPRVWQEKKYNNINFELMVQCN